MGADKEKEETFGGYGWWVTCMPEMKMAGLRMVTKMQGEMPAPRYRVAEQGVATMTAEGMSTGDEGVPTCPREVWLPAEDQRGHRGEGTVTTIWVVNSDSQTHLHQVAAWGPSQGKGGDGPALFPFLSIWHCGVKFHRLPAYITINHRARPHRRHDLELCEVI